MHRKQLCQALEQYKATKFIYDEERSVIQCFFDFIEKNPHCFYRSNFGHITASAWILNHESSKVLLTHHRKLNAWYQVGGHNDGDNDCQQVALKEALEESGIEKLQLILPSIFDIDIHPIPNACAYHYDVRYLLQAPRDAQFQVSEESHNLAWVKLEDLENYTAERSVLRMRNKLELLTRD